MAVLVSNQMERTAELEPLSADADTRRFSLEPGDGPLAGQLAHHAAQATALGLVPTLELPGAAHVWRWIGIRTTH